MLKRALLVALGALATAAPLAAQTVVPWTVLVYLQSNVPTAQGNYGPAAVNTINELEQVGSNSSLNILVEWNRGTQADPLRTAFPTDTTQTWVGCRRGLVIADPNQSALTDPRTIANGSVPQRIITNGWQDLGIVDPSLTATLVDYVTWAKRSFPAQHYLLVMSGPGQSYQPRSVGSRGLFFDATSLGYISNTNLTTTLAAVKTALGQNLDGLVLETGGSSTIEVLDHVTNGANNVVTQFLDRQRTNVVNGGLPHEQLVAPLATLTAPVTNSDIQTWLLSSVSAYLAGYGVATTEPGGAQTVSMSMIRPNLVAPVVTALDNFGQALAANLPITAPALLRILPKLQRGRAADYTRDFVDAAQFATLVQLELPLQSTLVATSQAVIDAVSAVMVNALPQVSETGDVSLANYHGVPVYFPDNISNYDTAYATASLFGSTTKWPAFVQGFLTYYADRTPPTINIIQPISGATVLDNPPAIAATIIDTNVGGVVDPASIVLTLDGTVIPSTAYTYDAASGLLSYTAPARMSVAYHVVTVSASDVSGNPATPVSSNFRIAVQTLQTGIQTFSLPRMVTAAEADPALVFGSGNFSAARWVSALAGTSKYRLWPDAYGGFYPTDAQPSAGTRTVVSPPAGLGYFIKVTRSQPVPTLPGTPITAASYAIQMYNEPGGGSNWNMIGAPYDVPGISLASTVVQTTDGRQISFQEAIDSNYTPGVLFTYVPNAVNPGAAGHYDFAEPGAGQLLRLQGHWLRVDKRFALVFYQGRAQLGVGRNAPEPAHRPAGGWSLDLWAGLEADADRTRYTDRVIVGAGGQLAEGCNRRWDIEAPPVPAGGLTLRSVHTDWGASNGRYLRDYRGAAGLARWDVEFAGPAGAAEVTWPALRDVPGDIDLTLLDPVNGQVTNLRTSGAYRFTHTGGARGLVLSAVRRTDATLLLSDVTCEPGRAGGAYSIAFTLSRAAQVSATLSGLGGQALRTLGAVSAEVGRGVVGWDGRDAQGRPLPSGVYRLEVVARGADGSLARSVRTVRLVH